jgi:hypothetical protein
LCSKTGYFIIILGIYRIFQLLYWPIMKRSLAAFLFLVSSTSAFSQFYLSAGGGGNWNDNIWDTNFDGIPDTGSPGPTDVAIITAGNPVALSANVEVGDLYIVFNETNALTKGGLFFIPYTLTINGLLSGIAADLSAPVEPNTTVIENATGLTIVFTNNNNSTPNITSWGHTATLKNVIVNPSSPSTTVQFDDVAINASTLSINNGTLRINQGFALADATGNSTINVNSGNSLDIRGGVNGGAASSNFNEIVIDGSVTINTAGYLNSTTVDLNAGSLVDIKNLSTTGWWNSSAPGPTSVPVDPSSTIEYSAATGTQTVYAGNYANLTLSSGGTKTLASTGQLTAQGTVRVTAGTTFDTSGNLTVIFLSGNVVNNGTWNPTQTVVFDGGTNQTLTGNGGVMNMAGLGVGGGPTTLSLSNIDIRLSTVLDIDPGATLDPASESIYISGIFQNDGTIVNNGIFYIEGDVELAGSGVNNFNDLIVLLGHTLSAPGKTISIGDELIVFGTYNNILGTTDFNGSIPQGIAGSGTISFHNLNISNSNSQVSNGATSATVSSTLTLGPSAVLDADGSSGTGSLTLLSTSNSNTARIAELGAGASINGNITVQRYISGTTSRWRNFGLSVSGATVSDIDPDAGFSLNGLDLAYYDETVLGGVDNGFVVLNDWGGTGLFNNIGYTLYTRSGDLPTTINFTGIVNQGTQTIPLYYTSSAGPTDDGWNLVNNPFPSAIDWRQVVKNASVDDQVAIWNSASNAYTYSSGTGAYVIASGQSFWVKTNAAGPTLQIPESAKVTNGGSSFLRTLGEDPEQLVISLTQGDDIDRAYVSFEDDATSDYDKKYDMYKKVNGIFNLSTISAGDTLAVSALKSDACSVSIPLNIDNVVGSKEYTLNVSGLSSLRRSYDALLTDNYLGTTEPLDEANNYVFSIDHAIPATFGAERFTLVLNSETINADINYVQLSSCGYNGTFSITNAQPGASYSLMKDGSVIYSEVASGSELVMPYTEDWVVEGSNIFDVEVIMNNACSSASFPGAIELQVSSRSEITNTFDGSSCEPGRVLLSAEGASGNEYYRWYSSLDSVEPIPGENGNQFLTPEIHTTKFYYVSIINQDGCESSERMKVTAEIVNLEEPVIIMEQDVLTTSMQADSYRWYFNGEIIAGADEPSYTAKQTGTYRVEATLGNCSVISQDFIAAILSIEELEEAGIAVYPNPVIGTLHLELGSMAVDQVLIFDSKGTIVYERFENFQDEIDLSGLSKGIYILNIATPEKAYSLRIKKK